MLAKYIDLNLNAKKYLVKELEKQFYKKHNDKQLLDRCYKEMDILYDKGLLFIIEHLYKYKKKDKYIGYHFRGTINNLLLLYILDISKVDPVKYNLSYELFTDKTINVDLINMHPFGLVWYLESLSDFKIVTGSFEKEEIEEINELEDNHYLIIPNCFPPADMTFKINQYSMFETIEDYRNYKDKYLVIRIDEKMPITDYNKIGVENVLNNNFEIEIAKILKPQTIDDYIKIKSISHGADVWNHNQEYLVKEGKINIKNLIATREDIFEYLINHSVDRDTAIEITNFIRTGKCHKVPHIWNRYVEIMKEHNCDEMFIEIFSKIRFIFGRGQAVSECLFAMDKKNYVDIKKN